LLSPQPLPERPLNSLTRLEISAVLALRVFSALARREGISTITVTIATVHQNDGREQPLEHLPPPLSNNFSTNFPDYPKLT
jgi:hypothetical protein